MKRIICVGNRYLDGDDTGAKVFDCLAGQPLPSDIDIIEGGVAGLNLLGVVDGAERIVFVDSVAGFSPRQEIVVLTAADVPKPMISSYDHASGLPYLFSVIPKVCDGVPPEIYLVGIEGMPNSTLVEQAACVCVSVAVEGGKSRFVGPEHASGGRDERIH